jgi:hypothetical protein
MRAMKVPKANFVILPHSTSPLEKVQFTYFFFPSFKTPPSQVLRCVSLDEIDGSDEDKMVGCVQHCHKELGHEFASAIVDRDNKGNCCW